MPEESAKSFTRDRAFSPQICLLTQGLDVIPPSQRSLVLDLTFALNRPEIFDEYTRRQYVAKAPHRNPFGVEEEPAKFVDFDIFTKVGSNYHGPYTLLTRLLQDSSTATTYSMDNGKSRSNPREDGGTKRRRTNHLGTLISPLYSASCTNIN